MTPRTEIAYLIMVHQQPAQLTRLVRALSDESCRLFIHVDADADIRPFEAALQGLDRVTLLRGRTRVSVRWGHVSCIEATLRLMTVASHDPADFDRYVLLSGADYPIKSGEQIRSTLAHPTAEYIRIWNELTPEARDYRYVSKRHFMRYSFSNPRSPHFRRLDQVLARKITQRFLRSFPDRRPVVGDITLFQGSQWWALTKACVRYILEYHQRRPEYLRFFNLVAGGDEIFFHSLVQNSRFASNVVPSLSYGHSPAVPQGLHFIDWSGRSRACPQECSTAETSQFWIVVRPYSLASSTKIRRGPSLTYSIRGSLATRSRTRLQAPWDR